MTVCAGLILTVITMSLLQACSSTPRRPEIPGETFGPAEPPPPAVDEVLGPPQNTGAPIVLVLGPGMARAFAYVGVLKALHEAKIPLGAVVGVEMGALVAALYTRSKTVHEFEWSLAQIKDACFLGEVKSSGLFFSESESKRRDECLAHSLQKAVPEGDVSTSTVPFRLGLAIQPSGQFAFLDRGPLHELIRAGFGFHDYIPKVEVDGRLIGAALESRPFPVDDAKLMNLGPVVAVSVLSGRLDGGTKAPLDMEYSPYYVKARTEGEAELMRADCVIRVDLHDMGFFDFKKRTTAAFRGKLAVQKQLIAIQKLIGKS